MVHIHCSHISDQCLKHTDEFKPVKKKLVMLFGVCLHQRSGEKASFSA